MNNEYLEKRNPPLLPEHIESSLLLTYLIVNGSVHNITREHANVLRKMIRNQFNIKCKNRYVECSLKLLPSSHGYSLYLTKAKG